MRRYVGGGLIKLEGEPSRKIVRKKAPHTKHTNNKALTYIRGEGSGDEATVADGVGFTYRELGSSCVILCRSVIGPFILKGSPSVRDYGYTT